MRVRIVKCSQPTYWYKNIIGKEFEPDLKKSTEDKYFYSYDGWYENYVDKADCKEIDTEVK